MSIENVECTAVSTSVITTKHTEIGLSLIDKTKCFLDSNPEVKSYQVTSEYEESETITLKLGKDSVQIRYVKGRY